MENNTLKEAPFEPVHDPFGANAAVVKSKINSLSGNQLEAMDYFVKELGKDGAQVLEGLTPEKINFLFAVFTERQQSRLAIARWNWIVKSIKYSFLSLLLAGISGHLVAYLVEDTPYDLWNILKSYVGYKWMRRWFLSLFFMASHNVYDSIMLQRAVKRVREFTTQWVKKMFRKKKKKEEKEAKK